MKHEKLLLACCLLLSSALTRLPVNAKDLHSHHMVARRHRHDNRHEPAKQNASLPHLEQGHGSQQHQKRQLSQIPVTGTVVQNAVGYPKWDFTDPTQKVYGVNFGNWFVLERWMDGVWFTNLAGKDTHDMWGFMKALGPAGSFAALTLHQNTYVNELDIVQLALAGINHVRVPMGFWSFIPVEDDEPFLDLGELDTLERLLALLSTHNMHAMISFHGMPGSQSGDQATGHSTTNPQWFTPHNQKRSDAMLDRMIDFIQTSPFGRVISSVLPVNEPCGPQGCTGDWFSITQDYYERSYQKLRAVGIPMIFHHGFLGLNAWLDFVNGKDPKYLIASDNPYMGFFPAKSDRSQILSMLCDRASIYQDFPMPVLATEWSLASGIYSDEWLLTYYNSQAANWAKAAGGAMWSYRCSGCDQWSWADLNTRGIIPHPTVGQSTVDFLKGLPNQQNC